MPSLNQSKLRRDGYVIVRDVIPADRLDDVREACEGVLDRQREIWRQEAGPDDLPGGVWDMRPQPRVPEFHALVDAETALAVELWLSEPVMSISRELLSGSEAVPMHMMMMCNPRTDHGPAKWHRDIGPLEVAPLWLLQEELAETGPRYLQWNLPLYDDDVLWVVPGSHRRLNTPEEDRRLRDDPRSPLPGGMPVELKAGDGLIYYHSMLHWGSNYSPKLRRTVHGGISIHAMPRDPGFTRHLSPSSAAAFQSWNRLAAEQRDLTAQALQGVLDGDAAAFRTALERLHPGAGPASKLTLTACVAEAARHIYLLRQPDFDELPEDLQREAKSVHPLTLGWGADFGERFSDAEADELWRRCDWLAQRLHAEPRQPVTVDDFVASWAA
ncbi:MAG: phytanoyl-CoA dioxygenase family protein [Chloroflexi bacterium]|nr:phytanoyl-CoA dioxygenase family protein [Chloroflexota bacterium]